MYQELDELVLNAKGGDIESKDKIIRCLNPLIYTSIKRYYNKASDYDDLMQEGRVIVLECIENHDNSKGAYFLGYVKTMLKYLYLNKHKEKITISLNESIGENGEDELMNKWTGGQEPCPLLSIEIKLPLNKKNVWWFFILIY